MSIPGLPRPALIFTAMTLLIAPSPAYVLGAQGDAAAEGRQRADLDAFVRGFVEQAMAERGIPGVTLSVVRDGEVLLETGYGHADLENGIVVDPERSVFRVGSVSKALTASVVLAAVDEGLLELDQDLRPLFADLPLEPEYELPLTLHQLMTFTGGFDEVLFGQHAATVADWRPLGDFLRCCLPRRFAPPGTVSAYNDYQTSLAALAVERAAGRRFERFAEERLLGPLGMERSSFAQSDLPAHMATWLARSYSGGPGDFEAYTRDYVMTPPAAGLWTTAADMRRYMLALLAPVDGGDRPVLSEAARESQLERQFAHHPRLRGWTYGFAERFHQGGRRYLFKDGQSSGFHARMVLVPQAGIGIFVAINRNVLGTLGAINTAGRFNRDLTDMLLGRLAFTDPVATDAKAPAEIADPEPVERFVGTYRNAVQSRHTPERIITAMDDFGVSAEDGRITIRGGPWVQVEPGLVQWHEGGPHYLAFGGGSADGPYRYLFAGTGAYERVPWYGASHNTGRILAGYLGLAALSLTGGLWLGRRRVRGIVLAGQASAHDIWDRDTGWMLALLAGLVAAVPAGVVLVMLGTDIQTLFKGFPWPFRLVLSLAIPALVLEGLLVLSLVRAWLRGTGTPWVRVVATGLALATLPYFPWLAYWNLLGPL